MTLDYSDLSQLHDGLLEVVQVKDKNARLELSTENGEGWVIEAQHVAHMRVDNFLEGNIVLDCEVIDEVDDAMHWLEWLSADGTDKIVKIWSERIASRQLSLLVITPSYGATLAILASSYSISLRAQDKGR